MMDKLKDLVDRVRKVEMTPAEFSEQRRSFVYGNTHIENELITREMVAQAEKTVEAEKK
ncbi:MAG: hypothetical protein HY659_09070 [Rhizobiales bacterium]|nr:hypothetical protein [Hyphomicrobiales bacterium]